MKFQPWENNKPPRREGVLEPGMRAAIDLLNDESANAKAEAKKLEANALTRELSHAAWLRYVATKISSNFLHARLMELTTANEAQGVKDAEQS